jgi:hypothetical protein
MLSENSKSLRIILHWLIPVATCIIGLHFTILGICNYNLSKIPGDLGDARFNMYILEHGYRYVTGQTPSYWNAPFMYPFPQVIALSDNLLGTMPVYAFFRLISFDRETSFQLWLITLCVLNFITTFYVLKKLVKHPILASAGAYIFAFSIFLYSQFNHVQVFPRFISPLVIYWTIRYFDRFELKFLCLVIAGIIYQFYCGMYLGFFLLMVTAMLFFVLFVINFQRIKQEMTFLFLRPVRKLALGIIAVIILLPIAIPYLRMHHITGPRNFNDVFLTVPFPLSFFFSTNASVPWRFLSEVGIRDNWAWWDQQIFIGLIPWLALTMTIFFCLKSPFRKNNKTLFAILVTLLLCILITLRIGNFTLFKWISKIPGFTSLGTVPRVMNIYLLFFALVMCMFINAVVKKNRTSWFSLLLVMILFDNFSRPSETGTINKLDSQNRLLHITDQLKNVSWEGKAAFAYMPKKIEKVSDAYVQLDGMMASQLIHKACINGYSSTAPGGFGPFWREYNEESLNVWLDFNKMDHSTIVIIH